MSIDTKIGEKTIYASDYLKLDSSVTLGGGTDETAALQEILDKANEYGSLHLIMDGAALVSGLVIHSNTIIECPSHECGFFLADNSDDAILKNANMTLGDIVDENIILRGGTYNHNGPNQIMNLPEEKQLPKEIWGGYVTCPLRFFGVKNLKIENVVIENQRRYALFMGNWENVEITGARLPLTEIVDSTTQDGLHFYGPGKNLTIRDVRGRCGDDFIALNTDEGDGVSSIRDVLIDGVELDGSYQAIRLLAKEEGSLENITIRNICGSVRAFGFYIVPWYWEKAVPDGVPKSGHYNNIIIENVSLIQKDNPYPYNTPFAFVLGGDIDCISFKNIKIQSGEPSFRAFSIREGHGLLSDNYISDEIAVPNDRVVWGIKHPIGMSPTRINNLLIDGLEVSDGGEGDIARNWIEIEGDVKIDNFEISNLVAETAVETDALIKIRDGSYVDNLTVNGYDIKGFEELACGDVKTLKTQSCHK